MKKGRTRKLCVLLALLTLANAFLVSLPAAAGNEAQVITYPFITPITGTDYAYDFLSDDYEITVNGQPVQVFRSYQYDPISTQFITGRPVSQTSFASFESDFAGPVEVKIIPNVKAEEEGGYRDLLPSAALSTTAGTMSGSALDNVKDPNHAWGWVSADADFAGKEFVIDLQSNAFVDKLVLGSIYGQTMGLSSIDLFYETADGWQLLLDDYALGWTGNSDAYEALEIPLGSAVETRKFKILVNTANVYWGQFRIDGLEVWGDTRDYRDFLPGAALSTTAETMSGSALDNVKDPNHAWGWVSAGTDFAGKEFVIDIGSSILADKLVIGSIWARDMALSNIDVYYDAEPAGSCFWTTMRFPGARTRPPTRRFRSPSARPSP